MKELEEEEKRLRDRKRKLKDDVRRYREGFVFHAQMANSVFLIF